MAQIERTANEDHETWLIEEGHLVIGRRASEGHSSLSNIERLIYSLWVADYGMRNAGDLDTAAEVFPEFLAEGRKAALDCRLPFAAETFALPTKQLETRYFELFDSLVDEVRTAHRTAERLDTHG